MFSGNLKIYTEKCNRKKQVKKDGIFISHNIMKTLCLYKLMFIQECVKI